MASEHQLKGISSLGRYSYTEILEHNLKSFLDWGLLNKGGFININIPTSGAYGGDFSKLRQVNDPRFTNGQVWESIRGNWVWESGLEFSTQPIQISGVFVGATFHPTSGNTFYIDYPNGRVVFNTAISLSANVRLAYSYKWVNVVGSDDVPWLKQVQQRSQRVDNTNFLIGSGNYHGMRETKLQLPVVAIEVASEDYEGYMLGGYQYCRNRIKCYVIGEDKGSVERLSHVIANQNEKTIFMFDSNLLAQNERFPLDYKGSKTANCLTYPDLVNHSGQNGFRYTSEVLHGMLSFGNSRRQEPQKLTDNLWQRVVDIETEAVLTRI